MKKFLFLLLFLFINNVNSQGLNLSSPEKISEYSEFISDDFGFATSTPSRYSLKQYVPPVRKQKGGTCVGFSTYYYALSTMYNKQFNITNSKAKYAHSFDPYFLYSIYFSNVDNCDSGLQFDYVLNSLKKIGSKKLLFPPYTNCNENWNREKFNQTLAYTKPYSIDTWFYVKLQNPNYLNNIKNLVFNGFPVIIGVEVSKSLYSYRSDNEAGVSSTGLWSPQNNEKKEGGHAMCIVGYDDYKYGGAFLIVNSWGKDYGDDGYIWIKYGDFKSNVKEAYILKINKNIVNKPPKVISTVDYKRYKYKTKNNNYSYYEGQYKNNSITGYGIWSDSDDRTFYAGQFDDGKMNGFFLVLDKDGFYSANAVNGKLQDFEKLGFAADNTLMNTQLEAKKYFSNFGLPLSSIRKANSTKTNKPKSNGKD